jgi:hypothetical protein
MKAKQDFIDQYTRKLLVDWAHHEAAAGALVELEACSPKQCAYGYRVYVAHAVGRGWLVKDGSRVSAKGFAVAASFLRR